MASEREPDRGSSIRLILLRPAPTDAVVDAVARALDEIFHFRIAGTDATDLPPWTYMPQRRQYDSTELLHVLARRTAGADKVLGITEADLGMAIFTFVFGEAELGGRAAVVSAHRLHQAFYGLPPDPALLAERTAREAVHEAGHTLGLTHCRNAACVMHASDTVADTDVKGRGLCAPCCARLRAPSG